jgi:DNA-directed RNA polymerase specialized sigma24 family protein
MTRWADDLRSPDLRVRDFAASQIWERYSARLLALVRSNLNERIRVREDPDDILQNLYNSFCANRQRAADPLRSREELWRLLAHIAMCKIANAAQHHQAARRDVRREAAGPGAQGDDSSFPRWILEQMDRAEPSPEEALILGEELEQWLELLPADLRQVALWKLEGYTNKEIGGMIQRVERTVELKLKIIRGHLEARLPAVGPPLPSQISSPGVASSDG